jgi:hypothetical protein
MILVSSWDIEIQENPSPDGIPKTLFLEHGQGCLVADV